MPGQEICCFSETKKCWVLVPAKILKVINGSTPPPIKFPNIFYYLILWPNMKDYQKLKMMVYDTANLTLLYSILMQK